MTREDIECIIKWFSHIEQLATDGKTANGFQMPPDKILATIKVVAKDSREYVEKFFNESIPNNLEEAAKKHAHCPFTDDDGNFHEDAFDVNAYHDFIAGAKWQESHTPLPEDSVLFNKGVEEGKRLMMKEAVEGKVAERVQGKLYARCQVPKTMGVEFGDRVRVIVLPKED